MNLFSFKNKSYLSLVFDIRDTFISVAATKFENKKKPEIIYCQRFKININNIDAGKKYITSMIKALDKAVLSTRKNLVKIGNDDIIKNYFFFIGSPWSVSQNKMIKVIKDKDFIIDNKFLEKLILNEENKIEKEIENNSKGLDWKIIEEKIIQSKLNGYKINDIYEKKTKDIEVDIFVSFAPQDLLNKISLNIDPKLSKKQISSCMLPSFTFFRDLYSDKNTFLYVDIGETITDICVVRDDVVFGIGSFPFGERKIIQSISEKTKTSEEIVLSYINMKCHGKCAEKDLDKIEDFINIGMSEWFKRFDDIIVKICSEKDIPKNILMLPNTDLSRIFSERIKNNNYLELFKKFGIKTNVTVVKENILDDFIVNGNFFKGEPYIKMDLIFINNNFIK